MKKTTIHQLRENYTKGTLEIGDLKDLPLDQFRVWFEAAIDFGVNEPNAATLSTVNESGMPTGRTILMKDLNDEGVIFYTNLNSDKAQHIFRNENVSLTFLWLEMERQIRINGKASKVDDKTATTYYQSRPKASQIGAWASEQSKIIEDRKGIETRVEELQIQYKDHDYLPKPPFWGGFIIKPTHVEFWQGRRSRLHDRLRYDLSSENSWDIVRLSP